LFCEVRLLGRIGATGWRMYPNGRKLLWGQFWLWDEGKKFAYDLYFGNMLKNWVISIYFKLKSRFLLPLVGHLLIFE
jgi:hypothetical protein